MPSEGLSCAEVQLLSTLAAAYHTEVADLSDENISSEAVSAVSARLAHHYRFMPLHRVNGRLCIAVSDPSDLAMQDDISRILRTPLLIRVASLESIDKAIRKYYGVGADTIEQIIQDRDLEEAISVRHGQQDSDISDMTIDASIVKFVNQIFVEACRDRATDIHFEPFENQYRIRVRIDGLLYEIPIPESLRYFQQEIVSRIKIMAGLDIAETRLPQDGRIKITIDGEETDLRISVLPFVHGEGTSIRILQSRGSFLDLDELGFDAQDIAIFDRIFRKTHGIVLVTGPTGSGKTTTLYAALDRMNSLERKILTIEDPVEYQLHGVCQMQVKPKIGFDFASGLRSILRHDPDVILVGEIRDHETAELAIRASLTGHLVFSTLHTNNAPGSITRLQDLGIDSYLLSSSLECIMAQRLVRVNCGACREPCSPSDRILESLDAHCEPASTFYRGRGCAKCHSSGYFGRTAISETLVISDEIRRLIMERAPANVIRTAALARGMRTLRQDGWRKVVSGFTTVDEVFRVTQDDAD